MEYIIFDLEINSKPFKNSHPNEIIEIGAVKLDSELREIDSFQSFIKPRIYRKLFSIVKRKTHIDQNDINNAYSFRTVLSKFRKWIGNDYILCCWGHDDIHHLKTNCEFNHLKTNWLLNNVDIQKHFSQIYEMPKGQRFSLKEALEMLNIEPVEELHRADIDAKYTAQIFKKTYDQMEIKV